ncbi:MAG: ATP-binding protein [Candidatus Methanoplasma sp.]|jgi:AAA+ ATPase superfamily predicted ATPase|nr:ATP-binding protein [Candidatus Methanoplasma sp.]
MRFVGREEEMRLLEREYARESGSFVVIYGRRRIGKTALISEFIRGRDSVYFLAGDLPDSENRKRFSEAVGAAIGAPGASFDSWESAFGSLIGRRGKTIVVLDEFQYLARSNPGFPSILQGIWDGAMKDSGLMLVLCGSFMGMMERYALSHSSPLYGRRTANVKLGPLSLCDASEAFPDLCPRDLVTLYAVTGGVPRYLELFHGEPSVREGIRRVVLERTGALHDEPLFLLGSEAKEPTNYIAILEAIAAGNSKLGDITGRLEVGSGAVTPYLKALEDMMLVRRTVPVTENPLRSKSGLYAICDGFTAFWFKFVFPNKRFLELGETGEAERMLDEHLGDGFASFAFEDICRSATFRMRERIGFPFTKVGRLWGKGAEIDVVALDPSSRRAFAAECKYSANRVSLSVYQGLKRKCAEDARLREYEVTYGIFSLSGFDENLVREAERDGAVLISMEDILEAGRGARSG